MISAAIGSASAYQAGMAAGGTQVSPRRSPIAIPGARSESVCRSPQVWPESNRQGFRSTTSSEHPAQSFVVSLRPTYGHTGSSGSFLSGVTN